MWLVENIFNTTDEEFLLWIYKGLQINKKNTHNSADQWVKKKTTNKHFTDGETRMNNKHMNRCSTSLVIKPQGNTTVPPLNCHKFKSLTISSVRGDENPCEFLNVATESLHLAVLLGEKLCVSSNWTCISPLSQQPHS